MTLASVLPGGTPALVRANGEILLGVQLQTSSDDVSRDLGTALAAALEAPAGAPVDPGPIGGAGSAGPRLQELLDPTAPLEVTVHDDFGFWLEGTEPSTPRRRPGWSTPTRRSCRPSGWRAWRPPTGCGPSDERAHLRWVRPEPEEKLLDALARLRRRRQQILLGEGTRYAGAFRAHGSSSRCGTCRPTPRREDWAGPATGSSRPGSSRRSRSPSR